MVDRYDVALDSDGDLPEKPYLITGPELTAQKVQVRLNTLLGEWILDGSQGVPWQAWRQAKPIPEAEMEAKIRSEIDTTTGVIEITRFVPTVSADRRDMSIEAAARIEGGTIQIFAATSPATPSGNTRPIVVVLFRSGVIAP